MFIKDKNINFLLYLVLFTVFLDFSVGKIYEGFYFSKNSKKNDALIHSVMETNEDILVFGSSRALHHYNPRIIEDSMGITCYNVGSGGQNIYYHLALLEAALERYRPKIVILELMTIDFELTSSQWETEKLGVLLPFYDRSKAAQNAVLRRGISERVKTNSCIYPLNSLLYTSFRNNFLPFNNHINGYIPVKKVWNKTLEKEQISSSNVDTMKINSLFHFVNLCQSNNIEIFILISPHYSNKNRNSRYDNIIEQLKSKFGVKVFNFEDDQYFLSKQSLFADPVHLNSKGADEYTSMISNIIKHNFKKD